MISRAKLEIVADLVADLATDGHDGLAVARGAGISPTMLAELSDRVELRIREPIPADVPPKIRPPTRGMASANVEVSATFIKELRLEYLKGGDDRTKLVGSLDDVEEWLAGLKPTKLRKRA
jgi:hypothetical protein